MSWLRWPKSSAWSWWTFPKITVEPDTLEVDAAQACAPHRSCRSRAKTARCVVAIGDPFDVYALDELQTLTGLQLHPVLASPREIARLIKTHFGVGGETVTAHGCRPQQGEVELLEDIEADDSEMAKMAQEASVVKLVNEILVEAANERASDIHVEPEEKHSADSLSDRRSVADSDACRRKSLAFKRDHQPDQNHGPAQHRREAAAARRPHQDARPRPGNRRPRFDHSR